MSAFVLGSYGVIHAPVWTCEVGKKVVWASVLILYFLMEACVVTDVLIYSRDTVWHGCARERPRESPQDSWATLSSNPSTFQRHNSPPLFTSISTSAYFSSLISHSSLPPSHSQPLSSSLSSPDPTLQPTDRQRFTSSFARSASCAPSSAFYPKATVT